MTMRRSLIFLLSTVLLVFLSTQFCVHAQEARVNGRNGDQFDVVEPGTPEFKTRKREACPKFIRTLDGTCTNFPNKLWGSAGTPHYSYVHGSTSKEPTGQDLPSPRLVSNVLCSQTSSVLNRRGLTEFVLYFAQFLDHTTVATASNSSEPMYIPIPKDDPIMANFTKGSLPFHRSVRGNVMHEPNAERPINTLSSACDLASVYSSDDGRIKALRAYKDGLLKVSANDMLPLNTKGLVNAPTKEEVYYIAGDHRANEHPVLTSMHTLFVREHNRLARELKAVFPNWKDGRLFHIARKINCAQFQKIVYEEFLPAMMGRELPRYNGFNAHVDPSLSDIFTTAAYRIGHTMVAEEVTRRGPGMSHMKPLPVSQMFFRTAKILNGGIEPFIRGSIDVLSQEIDLLVSSSLRNHLFKNIPQESGFDLISLNIQRGRDHALPTYNTIRKMFGRGPARSFRHITKVLAVQGKLATLYGTPDRVEAWAGLMAEDHIAKASMGPTLFRVWRAEFRRMRDGDRFFYKRNKTFPKKVWLKVRRVREMMFEKDTMKQIILRNSDIEATDIKGSIWKKEG